MMNKTKKRILCLTASIGFLLTGCSPSAYAYKNSLQSKNVQSVKTDENENTKTDYNQQWAIIHTKSNEAWNILKQRKEIKVAIVDTGVDYNHPALKNKLLMDKAYNFIDNNKDVMDDNWHGTHVAGIIAAEPVNGSGITGVTGNANVKIIPIKALDKDGQGSSDIMAEGIKYAADAGADIINFSVGFKVKDPFISDAIKYARSKGVLVIVSAGNNAENCDNSSPSADDGAYTVTSINEEDLRSSFSNFGSSVKIAAPGEEILSTIPGGGYDYRNGTSMAAPFVAGIAAMIKAENPSLTPEDIENILDKSSKDIMAKGKDMETGYGLVDAAAAVKMAENYDGRSRLTMANEEVKELTGTLLNNIKRKS